MAGVGFHSFPTHRSGIGLSPLLIRGHREGELAFGYAWSLLRIR